MSRRHRFTVSEDDAGQRLDVTLARLHDGWSRSQARRLVDEDRVRVNGRALRASAVLAAGDAVEVDEPDPRPADALPEPIPLSILHEDEHLLVLDKPAGLVVHPAAGNPAGTLVNALLHHCRDLSGIGGVERPGIVHRLDKDTTGLMVVAKDNSTHQALGLAFRRRDVEKTYLAVCYGVPEPREGVVDAPLDRHPRERTRMAVVADGRPARTIYRVEEALTGTALVACRLVTGRTHQIRVHLAHVGHALVGDPVYSGRQWRALPAAAGAACRDFPRQALHAWRLAFAHPASGERVQFEAPIPADIAELVERLR